MRAFVVSALAGMAIGSIACSTEAILQGDDYRPDNALPIASPSERVVDASLGSDGAFDASTGDAGLEPPTEGNVAPKNTCESARNLSVLSGDTTGPSLSTKGSCAEWVRFRAIESDSGVFGKAMKLTVTLTPPPDEDLMLYAFVRLDRDEVVCAPATAGSVSGGVGGIESVTLSWGEGSISNGADDGRTVNLLVLHAGPSCDSNGTWSLSIDGNR